MTILSARASDRSDSEEPGGRTLDVVPAGYVLGTDTLAIRARRSAIASALAEMFHLCPRSTARPTIALHAVDVAPHEVGPLLPAFFTPDVLRELPANVAAMVPTPARQSACIARVRDVRCYAWASDAGRRIDLVCETHRPADVPIIQPVLNPVLRDVLLWRDQLLVHAALAATPSGHGQMILAPSGGGKTTTALAIVRTGGRLIADDLVLIGTDTPTPIGHGIPKLLNLRSGTMAFFPELRNRSEAKIRMTGERRTNLSPLAVYGPRSLAPNHGIDAIYFSRLSPIGPIVRRLGVAEALARLIRAHAFSQTQRIDAHSTVRLSDLLSRVPAYDLQSGPDPAALGLWLSRHAAAHAAGWGEGS